MLETTTGKIDFDYNIYLMEAGFLNYLITRYNIPLIIRILQVETEELNSRNLSELQAFQVVIRKVNNSAFSFSSKQ